MATKPWLKKLWKASKYYQIPLFSPIMGEFNKYDLELMDFLELFEDPEREKIYLNTYIDSEFNELWEEYNSDEEVKEFDNPDTSTVDVNNEDEWIEVMEDE